MRTYLVLVALMLVSGCSLLISTADLAGGEAADVVTDAAADATVSQTSDAGATQDATAPVDTCALANVSDGPRDPTSAIVQGGAGSVWNSPQRACGIDDSSAQAVFSSNSSSRMLYTSGYGLAVPTTAVVTGVEVVVTRRATSSSSIRDLDVGLISNGTILSANRARSSFWETTNTSITYGGSDDLWGTSWLPSHFGDSQFGVGLSVQAVDAAQAFVDTISVKVYFKCE